MVQVMLVFSGVETALCEPLYWPLALIVLDLAAVAQIVGTARCGIGYDGSDLWLWSWRFWLRWL